MLRKRLQITILNRKRERERERKISFDLSGCLRRRDSQMSESRREKEREPVMENR